MEPDAGNEGETSDFNEVGSDEAEVPLSTENVSSEVPRITVGGRNSTRTSVPVVKFDVKETTNRKSSRELRKGRSRNVSESSVSSSGSDASGVQYKKPPDGGYGWVIVICSLLVNLIADGVTFSFGVLYVELLKYFGESKSNTAWVGSIFMGMPLISGPIASSLTDHFGCRKVTIFGALLAALGFILSTFCNSLESLVFTFSILSGFGLSLCYVAAIVIVAYYFEKKRSFATGISVCGSGIGTFLIAPLTQFLIDTYDWRGAILILSGLFLNMCVCGALMRDLEWTRRKSRAEKGSKTQSTDSVLSKPHISAATSDELKAWFESGEITRLMEDSFDERLEDRLCSSAANIPTYLKSGEELPPEIVEALSVHPSVTNWLEKRSGSENIMSSATGDDCTPEFSRRRSLSTPEHPKRETMKLTRSHTIESGVHSSNRKDYLTDSLVTEHILRDIRMRRIFSDGEDPAEMTPCYVDSLTYRGAMLDIHRYRTRACSCPDIYGNSMTSIVAETNSQVKIFMGIMKEVVQALKKMFDLKFFSSAKFLLFTLSNFMLYVFYDVPYIYLADYALELGFNQDDASLLISTIGILNMFGEVMLGWLGDREWASPIWVYSLCMVVCGASCAVVPWITGYTGLAIVAGTYGFCISANYSLTSIILVDLISLEKFSNAYGLLLLVQGIGNLIGPPLAGYMYDTTGSFDMMFWSSAIVITFCGLMLMVLPSLKKWRRYNRSSSSSPSPEKNDDSLFQPTHSI